VSAGSAVATASFIPRQRPAPVSESAVPERQQRVKVPMRLVESPFYADAALSVYMKIQALGRRPEGCTAGAATLASYLGVSTSTVERGIAQLRRPAPDGVVELPENTRRSLPGGRGTTARRRVRPLTAVERFVWLPVAACEDLSPRQLRAYAVIAYAVVQKIPLTEGELAGFLRHHSGERAGQPITVEAAGQVVDALEASRWITVDRRAGAQGRHRFVAHDIPPAERPQACVEEVDTPEEAAVDNCLVPAPKASEAVSSSFAGDGSGPRPDDGSLANREDQKTARPDDERALPSPAVGEVQVSGGVENPDGPFARERGWDGLALRADKNTILPTTSMEKKQARSRVGGSRSSYDGPPLTLSARIYAVLEPVHWLLQQVGSTWVQRRIAREVGRQLRAGMEDDRLRHRLTMRLASTSLEEISDPGRWLLGVALPRWGCGHQDCESGVMWSTGAACAVCEEVVADRRATKQRELRRGRGLCPEHGSPPGPSGSCRDCEVEQTDTAPAVTVPAAREPEGPSRGACGDCAGSSSSAPP
jgi:hypothetical protein